MKFPLYNECPNCGGYLHEHEYDERLRGRGCRCHERKNKPIRDRIEALAGRVDQEALDEYNSLWPQVTRCDCHLLQSDVAQAISIQAAVEVAQNRMPRLDRVERLLEILILQSEHGKGTGSGSSIPFDCMKCNVHVAANEFHNCAQAAKDKLAKEVLNR
jgi:hypothetical protein